MDQFRNIHQGVNAGALDANVAERETERAHRGKRSRRPGEKRGWLRRLFGRSKTTS